MATDRRPIPLRELVRHRRLELQWSQREAAEAAGVSLGTWQALEREDPGGEFQDLTLTRVASALELPPKEVFAAAGRSWWDDHQERDGVVADPEHAPARDLVDEITADLRRLGEHSRDDLLLVYSFVKEFTDHLLRREERE